MYLSGDGVWKGRGEGGSLDRHILASVMGESPFLAFSFQLSARAW